MTAELRAARAGMRFVVPVEGRVVSFPWPNSPGRVLDAVGEWVSATKFWSRRVMCGDCIDDTSEQLKREAAAAAAAEAPAPAPSKASKKGSSNAE